MGAIQRKAFFPAPNRSYSDSGILMMIPDSRVYRFPYFSSSNAYTVPLVFLPYYLNKKDDISPTSLLYFHGNAQDIGHSMPLLDQFRKYLKVNIFAIEYPGYGTSTQTNQDPDIIKSNALEIYKIINKAGFQHENIVVFGRSIGTGPASYIGGMLKEVRNMVLMSPLSSVKEVTKDYSRFASVFVSNYFDNANWMRQTQARLLVIHGKADEVIPFHNGQAVVDAYNSGHEDKAIFVAPTTMSHNDFNLQGDILKPTRDFLPKSDKPLDFSQIDKNLKELTIPKQPDYPSRSCL